MSKIVLKNSMVMCEAGFRRHEVLIDGPYITKIEPQINESGAKEIDCRGMLVFPGLIDAHVHFRDPGMPQKATIYSESRAAALGGVTSFIDMPNTNPATTTIEALNAKKAVASKDSLINYGFYLGGTGNNIEEIKKVNPHEVAGIKLYMGSTTGDLLVDEENKLLQSFEAAPNLVATHCEDNAIINENTKRAREEYGDDNIPFEIHNIIRSRDCCVKSTQLAIAMAEHTKKRLHVMHLSTKEELALMQPYVASKEPLATRLVTGEACIPHLFFNESDYSRLKGFLKCNPAIKNEQDRRALVQGLRSGLISTIGTDHAPHELAVKQGQPYLKTASGIPSVQYSLNVILELFKRGEISLEEGIRAATRNVAERYGIEKRGVIKEGNFADIVVVDLGERMRVFADDIKSLCGWSPFTGTSFATSVVHTIASGVQVVENGQLCAETGNPMALTYNQVAY